jgi:hypothetical protein
MATNFGPDPVYESKSDSDAYTVNKENAEVSLIEPSVVKIDSTTDSSPTNGNADSINLLLTVDEVNDGYLSSALPGPAPSTLLGLNNARPIAVSVSRVSNGTIAKTCTASNTTYVPSDPDTAQASCTITDVVPDTYQVDATIQGDYFVGSGIGALVVYDPALGFITGGGWYTTDLGRVNFGFNAKILKSQQVQGSLLVILHRPEGNYVLKSNAMGSLTVTKDTSGAFWTAVLKGKATYQVPPSQPLLWCNDRKCGGYTWTMYVEDRAEPGSGVDKFWLEVKDPSNAVVSKLSLPQLPATNAKIIDHGNIQVPQPQSSG